MPDRFHWLDVDRISEELADTHPALDPMHLKFVELRDLVKKLPGFEERPGHPVNEKILEAIQMAWLEERGGAPPRDNEDDDEP